MTARYHLRWLQMLNYCSVLNLSGSCVSRQRHTAAADRAPWTTESDVTDQQYGGAAVRRQWRPASHGPLVQERPTAHARRASIPAT